MLLANQAAGFAAVLTTGLLSPAALVASFQVGCCMEGRGGRGEGQGAAQDLYRPEAA